MKKVVLCIVMLCSFIAAISQNPILLKDAYYGITGDGIQQIVKSSDYTFFNDEGAGADTERSLLRTDGTPTGSLKYDLSYTAYSNFTIDYSFNSAAIDNWGVVGSATPNGWVGPDMPLTYDANANTWSAVVSLSNGEIKFRNNNDWAFNYGDNGADGSLDAGGSNIAVAAGTYLITLDFTTLNYSLKTPFISIPDPNFEQALTDLGYDKDGVINASISTSDAEAITQLDVTGKNISSLQGIEAFINLSRLFCQNNQLQVLDISKNTALTVLECGGNQLTTLNVSKNLLLRTLGFGYNNISAIDVSKNLKLEVFWCNNNNITSQNLDLNTALAVVGLSNNPLTFVSLKNGNNVKIVYFEAFNTPKLACINADAVVSVSMTNSGKTFNENCAKSYYVNNNSQTGDVFTSAIGNNTNPGTKAEPFATITYALSQANERDTIYVDAGSYTEQVTIEKGISLIGAGANLTSILVPTTTVNPPGFGEQGVIQTAQNISDVHISNMTVTGRFNPGPGITPLILQTGGSVKNCRLLNGNQGIFFRVASALKTALVENNEIDAEYIAVNFEGVNLTATLNNNTLSTNNAGFSAGMFAFVNQITATNNLFSKYVSSGMQISANNASITQNAFTGAGTLAINRTGGATVTANCNWYGTTNATSVVTKVNGGVIYYPWLLDGTDASAQSGFQHNETCGASANIYYVNDNSTAEDIFTTTVGNDANTGTSPTTPLATIDAAITKASPGATIYVDAGAYLPGDFTISKAVKIYGANYHISPNDVSNALLPNAERDLNKETFITGSTISIGSNDISLEGLYFDPGAKSQIVLTNTGYNNFSYKKNYSRITSGTFISLTGPTIPNSQTPAFGNHIIEDNRFEKTGTGGGIGITAGYLNNVTVNSNAFVTPSTATQRTLVNSYAGFGGVVTNFKYSNNVSLASNYDVFSFYLTSGVIENNIGMHGQRPLVIQTVAAGSSNVRISNNYFESDFAVNPPISYGCFDTGSPGSSSTAIIELNTVIQNPAGRNNVPIACRVQIAGTVFNPTATIRNNRFTFNGDYGSFTTSAITGLSLFGKLQTVFVENNELTFNGTNLTNTIPLNAPASSGIYLASDGGIANAIPSNAVMNFTGNKISGFGNSIAVYDASATAPNTFVGYGNLPAGATVNINNNSFAGDSISINNGSVGASVNATCNWFGTASAQNILSKVSNNAQIFPYLTDGTDTDAATGFQPTANTCDGSIPLITLNSFTNATCNGAANGSLNITASFGKAPIVFTWTKVGVANFISNNEDPSSFAAGTYRLAITDANGTTIYKTSVEGAALDTLEVTITEPSAVTASISNTSTACSNIATVAADGGTPGYTYLWSNGSTSPTISGVPSGAYTVTVTDANGCATTTNVTLTVSEAFNPSASVTSVTCFGANDGVITVTNLNGTAPFMFSKDGGVSFENGSLPFSFTNLAPGNYTIAVKDANGCVGFVERTVTQPTPLTVTINTVQSTCFGASTGAINVSVSGGVTAYSYSWTKEGGGFSSSQLNISGLAEGNYTLTVTDKNNCAYSVEVNVPTNPEIVVNESINHVTCRGAADGSISVDATGGSNTNFSYLWNTGATTTTINNLAPGNYSVLVTDNGSGCFVNKSFTIIQPASVISLATAKTNATGCNSLGTITAEGSGGTAPYTYSVNGAAITGNSIGGLYAGDYNITVTDANGCTTSKLVAITDNGSDEYEGNNSRNQAKTILVGSSINARLAVTNDAADWFTFTAPGSTTGLYSIKITHPTAVYAVNVYPSGKNTAALVPVSVITEGERHYQLAAGATYFVSITTTTLSYICYNFTVSALEPIEGAANRTESKIAAAPTVEILKAFTYPNPHNGNFTLSIESPEEGVATVELYTVNGQKLSERKANVVKGNGNTVKYSNMNYAILFYKVRIGKHVVTGKIISPN